tara:strand:- start:8 stop:304 length:297 start_codon:yes stop_codon:yes gene_type:complete
MMPRFLIATEIKKNRGPAAKQEYNLVQIALNVDNVISIRDYGEFKKRLLDSEAWPTGLDTRVGLTKVTLNTSGYAASGLVLAGDLITIMEKIEALNGV